MEQVLVAQGLGEHVLILLHEIVQLLDQLTLLLFGSFGLLLEKLERTVSTNTAEQANERTTHLVFCDQIGVLGVDVRVLHLNGGEIAARLTQL